MNSPFSFSHIKDKFQSLSQREQLLVVLVVAAAVYLMVDAWVVVPQGNRQKVLLATQVASQAQLRVRAEIEAVSRAGESMLSRNQAEHAQLKKQLALLEAISASVTSDAPRIGELVKGVLKSKYPQVKLASLKTLPVKALVAAPQAGGANSNAAAGAAPRTALYKHGVEIEIYGNYLDLLAYLQSLEANTTGVFWSDLKLSSVQYPETSLRVTIFMLSDQPTLGLT